MGGGKGGLCTPASLFYACHGISIGRHDISAFAFRLETTTWWTKSSAFSDCSIFGSQSPNCREASHVIWRNGLFIRLYANRTTLMYSGFCFHFFSNSLYTEKSTVRHSTWLERTNVSIKDSDSPLGSCSILLIWIFSLLNSVYQC